MPSGTVEAHRLLLPCSEFTFITPVEKPVEFSIQASFPLRSHKEYDRHSIFGFFNKVSDYYDML
jgi:hypothetical protein